MAYLSGCWINDFVSFQLVLTQLLESCMHYVSQKQSNLSHWHPVLGWFAQSTDASTHDAIPHVKHQLQLLWSGPMVRCLLGAPLAHMAQQMPHEDEPPNTTSSNIIRRYIAVCDTPCQGTLCVDSETLWVRNYSGQPSLSLCVLQQGFNIAGEKGNSGVS